MTDTTDTDDEQPKEEGHFPCRKCKATYEQGYDEDCALCLMSKDVAENRTFYDKMGEV